MTYTSKWIPDTLFGQKTTDETRKQDFLTKEKWPESKIDTSESIGLPPILADTPIQKRNRTKSKSKKIYKGEKCKKMKKKKTYFNNGLKFLSKKIVNIVIILLV